LLFVREHVQAVCDVAPAVYDDLETARREYAEMHRAHPFQVPPDFVARLRSLLGMILTMLFIQACRAPAGPDPTTGVDRELAAADATAVRAALDAFISPPRSVETHPAGRRCTRTTRW
jgi:hypothetical protein